MRKIHRGPRRSSVGLSLGMEITGRGALFTVALEGAVARGLASLTIQLCYFSSQMTKSQVADSQNFCMHLASWHRPGYSHQRKIFFLMFIYFGASTSQGGSERGGQSIRSRLCTDRLTAGSLMRGSNH